MSSHHDNVHSMMRQDSWRGREQHSLHQNGSYHHRAVNNMELQNSNTGLNNSFRSPPRMSLQSSSPPTAAQRLKDKHTTAQGWITSPVAPAASSREHSAAFLAPSHSEVQPRTSHRETETTPTIQRAPSQASDMNELIGAYGQCEIPTVTMTGVFEYFQEALSPGSRMIANHAAFEQPDSTYESKPNQAQKVMNRPVAKAPTRDTVVKQNITEDTARPPPRRQNTTISAMKEPGKRAGVIFTRLSNEQPNVAIISMIMHDSIFAQHNKDYGGKLEGSVVAAVNGVPVDDARHAARLMIMAEGEVSLAVEIAPLKSALEVEEVKERIAAGDVNIVRTLSGMVTTEQEEDEIPDEIPPVQSTLENRMELVLYDNASTVSGITADDVKPHSKIVLKQDVDEEIASVPSTLQEGLELEYKGTVSNTTIIDVAPSSLRQQLKNRMESRKHMFNPLDRNYSSLMSCATSEVSSVPSDVSSVKSRRMNLFADRLGVDDSCSVNSDTSRISRFLDLKRAQSLGNESKPEDQETVGTAPNGCIEDEIMTPKKNNVNSNLARFPSLRSTSSSNDDYYNVHGDTSKGSWPKDINKYQDDSQQLYANNSSATDSTVDLTYIPSYSHDEDGSVSNKQCTIESPAKKSTDSPRSNTESSAANKKYGLLTIDPCVYNDEERSIKDLPTPMLLQKIENLFGNINTSQDAPPPYALAPDDISVTSKDISTFISSTSSTEKKTPPAASAGRAENNVRANDVFDRIMNKYAKMSFDSTSTLEETKPAHKVSSNESGIFVARSVNNEALSLSSESLERVVTNKYFSNLLQTENKSVSQSVLCTELSQVRTQRSIDQRPVLPSNNLIDRMKMMEIQLKESIDAEDNYMVGSSYDDDDLSTLSRSTCLTIGSASFCSTDTKEIQSHVKLLVHGIVQKELKQTGSMKKELEGALKSKMMLESRVRKLSRHNSKQQLQLKEAHLKNETIVEEIDKEMTIHLTRKAAELKSCVEIALQQAEEAKKRAVEIARSDMEQEILTLRSELDEALANGIYLDASLQKALALVESNHQTLRIAAESNAREAVKMKTEIENSFVSTVDEFEEWAEKQATLMIKLEESMSGSGSINAEDEAKLVKIKKSLESAMGGMNRMQYKMKTRTQSGNHYSGYV